MENLEKKKGMLIDLEDLDKGDVFEFGFGIGKMFNIRDNFKVKVDYSDEQDFAKILARKWGTEEEIEIRESRNKTFIHIITKNNERRKTIPWIIKVIFIRKEE